LHFNEISLCGYAPIVKTGSVWECDIRKSQQIMIAFPPANAQEILAYKNSSRIAL